MSNFYGLNNPFPPTLSADGAAGDDFTDPEWAIVESPGADDTTLTGIYDWVPEAYVGVYAFDGEYIYDYFVNY